MEKTGSRYRIVVAVLVLLSNLALGLNLFSATPLLPLIIEDYSINRATAGLLITLPLLFAAIFGLPGGVIISRLGLRRAFTLGWSLISLMALSGVVPNFGTLLALRIAYGIGLAIIVTATGPLLMRWFRPKEILMMNGFNSAALCLGIALSVSTAAPLADVLGWRSALTVYSTISMVGTAAWVLLSQPVGPSSPSAPLVSFRELWAVLSNRTILLLVVADAGVLVQYTALTSWLPSFYNETRGLSLSQAGFVTGLLPFVGVFAVLLGGVLPYRFDSKRGFLIVSGVLVVLGGPASFLTGNLVGIYLSIITLGIGSWLYVPTLLSLPMELPGMTPEKVAIVWGFIITAAGFGMFVSPLLVGGLRDISGSFIPGFAVSAIAAWALLVAGIFLQPPASRRSEGRHSDRPN